MMAARKGLDTKYYITVSITRFQKAPYARILVQTTIDDDTSRKLTLAGQVVENMVTSNAISGTSVMRFECTSTPMWKEYQKGSGRTVSRFVASIEAHCRTSI